MQRSIVRREYERRHQELMQEYVRAKARRDIKLMARIEELDVQNLTAAKLTNFRISRTRQHGDVLLPKPESWDLDIKQYAR